MAKMWFIQSGKDVNKLAKLVKTNNYLNRMLLDPDQEITVRKAGKEAVKNIGVNCDLIQERVKIVEKEVIKIVQVPQADPVKKKEIPLNEKEALIAKFFKVIRGHCVAILLRETPE